MNRDLTPNEIECLLDQHLVTIVNLLRDGRTVPQVASMIEAPEWLVTRIGRDAHLIDQQGQRIKRRFL